MEKIHIYTIFSFFLLGLGFFQSLNAQDSISQSKRNYFQNDIEAFIKNDSTNPPPQNSIEFIGSSIFRLWKSLKSDMAPLPVYNRAFGGSRTSDVLYFMDNIVFPYHPKIIVYYCGSNDAAGHIPSKPITANITAFFERVEKRFPETKLFFVSVNKSPARKAMWGTIDSTNAFMKEFCSKSPRRTFIDVNPVLFDTQGNPRTELYVDDKLHFKDDAYAEFTKIIKPILTQEWTRKK